MRELRPLAGRTALVTGAARRLGKGVSLALAEAGVHVALHYRSSQAEAQSLAEEVRAQGVRAWTLAADLGHSEQVDELFAAAVDQAGALDILVNNASIFGEDTLDSLEVETLEANLRVNAVAPLLLARRFAAQNREGSIINFLDARMEDYDRMHASYHLSKRMLYTLTRMMALEFAPRVRVNAVAPGLILPPKGKDQRYLEELAHTNPLETHGNADDVSAAVLFLLRSDFVTGQVIYVDGGRHLKGRVYG